MSTHQKPKQQPLIEIAYAVAEKNRLTIHDLMSKLRSKNIVRARWQYFQAARDEGYSLEKIGAYVNRGHDTVIHGLNQLKVLERSKAKER
jgi:chromosomal replication initiation ATPase DnaA